MYNFVASFIKATKNKVYMTRNHSEALFEKAKTYFPGGVNSPVRAFRSVGGTPLFMKKGKGAFVWDEDDNKYIDFCCSWGPLILGHAPDEVVNAITETAQNGSSFGAPTALENDLASLILTHNPFIEKLRFVSSGTEAVMSAIRLARAYTGRHKVLKFEGCYHGHSDSLLVKAGSGLVTFGNTSSAGIPESFVNETIVVELNNKAALEEAFETFKNQIACIIIEPVPANNGLLIQSKEYLLFLREICTKHKTLLIFDEVISGFRLGFTGAAGYYQIKPDIITYGKIIGGGLPVGAYASSNEIMAQVSPDGPMYQAGTLSGNPVAMAAGIAQLKRCLQPGFYEMLTQKTHYFVTQISEQAKDSRIPFKILHLGSIFWIAFTEKEFISSASEINSNSMQKFRDFHRYLLDNGVYLGPSGYEVGFISAAHNNEQLEQSITVIVKGLLSLS